MVEETKKEPEEYKLKEEEYGAVYSPEATKLGETEEPSEREFAPGIAKPKLPIKKRVLIVIGIIVFLFIAYQFVAPRPSQQKPLPTPTPTGAPELATTAGQISQLNQKFIENSAKIKSIQDELNRTQTVLSKMDAAVYNLNIAVQELSKSVQDVAKQQAGLQKGKPKVRAPKVVYHVKAIVPGRAWLESSDGTIVTVRPGSKLKNYGTVTEIDDSQGIVKTDLGFVIKYGVGDI